MSVTAAGRDLRRYAADHGIAVPDLACLVLHVTGGRTTSTDEVTVSEDGKLRSEIDVVSARTPFGVRRMADIRDVTAPLAGSS